MARRAGRGCAASAAAWGYVFAAYVASSAYAYRRLYKTPAERARLAAAFGANRATSALFGPAPRLDTVAGFTAYKVLLTAAVTGALWGLFAATRLLRGEEDAGRWELLLAGPLSKRGATAQALGGLGAGAAVLFAVTAALSVLADRLTSLQVGYGAALFLAASLVAAPVMFLSLGALVSQLAASRRQAVGYGAGVLAVSYALRMLADARPDLHFLVWAAPFGWVEQLRPLTSPDYWPLCYVAAFTASCGAGAVLAAGRRDVGRGLVAARPVRRSRAALLGSPGELSLRLGRRSALSWTAATAACGLVLGLVASSAGRSIGGSSVERVFSRLGAPGTGAASYLSVAFVIVAVVVAFEAVSAVGSMRDEEEASRLDQLLAGPLGRTSWFTTRLLVAGAAVLASGLAAGLLAFAGGSGTAHVSAGSDLAAGLNVAPVALFFLGIGALAFAVWPRRAVLVVYLLLAWSVLIDFVGGFFQESHWLVDTSVFHQSAAAPAVPPHWVASGVVVAVALAAMALGGALFARRDLVAA